MKWYTVIPTFAVAFILQLTVCSIISINGVGPNLILCLLMTGVFLFPMENRCITCAVIAGLLLDMTAGKYAGIYAFTLLLIGLLTIAYKYFFNFESRLSVLPLAIIGTIAYHGISSLILFIGGMSMSIVKILIFTAGSLAWNLVLMYILYFIMIKKATARPKRSRYERYEII